MGIVRPVMVDFPFAWVFFIVFILCTSFTVLNLFIGIIVSAMQSEHEDTANKDRERLMERQEQIIVELGGSGAPWKNVIDAGKIIFLLRSIEINQRYYYES